MLPLENAMVTDIINLFTVSSPKGRYEKINNRHSYALTFCISGQITYTHNGRKVISDREHAVFLPQGESYHLHGDRSGDFPVINFYCQNRICDTVERVYIGNPDTYITEYERMKQLSLFDGSRAMLLSIFYGMLHRMKTHTDTDAVLEPAMKYIEANFTDRMLDNEQLAGLCGISEVYFRRLFTERFGTTPRQYIIDVRINRAKQLLCEGKLKVSAVSEACGFGDPYHFCRMFKQKTGIPPSEYMIKNTINTI